MTKIEVIQSHIPDTGKFEILCFHHKAGAMKGDKDCNETSIKEYPMGKQRFLSNVSKQSTNTGFSMPWSRDAKAGRKRAS